MPKGGGSKSAGSSPAQHKLKRLGQLASPRQPERLTFAVYFPTPPYRGAQYRAARGKDALYNFTGLVLGHGGATVQRIQKASGAKVEVRDAAGNLNGAHPASHGDPSLHAWVAATSRQRLDKAVALLLEVLQPTNTQLRPVTIVPGGSAVLQPVIPPDWPEAADAAAEAAATQVEAAEAAAAATPAAKPPPPPPPTNAWASNRLLKQLPRQLSPVSSLQRSQGPTGSSNVSSEDDEGEAPSPTYAAASRHEVQACPPPPPPPPPPRSVPQSPRQPATASDEQPAVPSTPEQPPLPRPAPHTLSPAHQQERQDAAAEQQQGQQAVPEQQQGQQAVPEQQRMAVVFATGLHSGESGSAGLPVTPPASPQRFPVAAQLDFGTADATESAAPSSSAGPSTTVAGSASLQATDGNAACLGAALHAATSLDTTGSIGSTATSLDGMGSTAMSLGGTGSSSMGMAHQLSGSSSRMLSGAPSSAASWSLWDQGSSGSSFYEQLQAAASDTFSIRTTSSSQSAAAAHLGGGHSHSHSPLDVASPAGALSPHLGSPPHTGSHVLPPLASPRAVPHGHAHALAHMGSPRHLSQGPLVSPLGSPPHAQHAQHAQQHAYLARQLSTHHLHAHPFAPQLAAHHQLVAHQQHLLSHPLAAPQLQAPALQSHPLAGLPAAHPLSPQQHALAPHAGLAHAHPGAASSLLAPFPGLSRHGQGASLASPTYSSGGLGSPPHAAAAALLQQQLLLAQAQQADADHDMHQLLAAVASMATLDG